MICNPDSKAHQKFSIEQADSAHQPEIEQNILQFEGLNDDCLWHISSFLDLIDIANLGKTSTRMQSFVHQIYRRHTKFTYGSDTGDSTINQTDLPTILQEIGSFVQSIEWHHLSVYQLNHLSEYCQNVSELKLINPAKRLRGPHIKNFTNFVRGITKLSISGGFFFDTTMKAITTASKITSLELDGCPNICGKFLSKWNNSKLESLKIRNSSSIDCHLVYDFIRKNHLVQFAFDAGCSFKQCVALPADCLSKFTDIELDFSYCNAEFLKKLNFDGLTRLTSLTMTYEYSNSAHCDNDLLMAISRVQTLKTLTIDAIRVDAVTIQCLGSLENLREIQLKRVVNTIGRQMYSSLPVHLPKLTSLSIDMRDNLNDLCQESFNELISAFVDLKYFWHSSTKCTKILNYFIASRTGQLPRKRYAIKIGLPKVKFDYMLERLGRRKVM